MLIQLLIGGLLIAATVAIHALVLDRFMAGAPAIGGAIRKYAKRRWKSDIMVITALTLFFAHVIEIALWAAVYRSLGESGTTEEAVYFSIATFTTVGFGDLVLSDEWRLLSSIEAADGMLLFGWSTAFLFAVMQRIWADAFNKP